MNGNEHISIEDLAMFALLLLSEEETAQVNAHLRTCATCGEELRRVREDLAMYALAVEPATVPAGARERFISSLAEAEGAAGAEASAPAIVPKTVPGGRGSILSPERLERPSGAARVLAWTGWAVAAAAAVVAAGLWQNRDALRSELRTEMTTSAGLRADARQAGRIVDTLTSPTAVSVDLTTPKTPAKPSARATYNQKSGTLFLLASNLAPLKPAKVYELWLIPADGGKPIAAGTFSPDAHGYASLLIPRLQGATAAKAFGITVEPTGGSASPTMPILLSGSPAQGA